MSDDKYIRALEIDAAVFQERQRSYLRTKTSQQRLLESLLETSGRTFREIADIACGGGALAAHLSALFPEARFTLVDLHEDMLETAANAMGARAQAVVDDIYELSKIEDESFDLTCCWQTLSWLTNPEAAVRQLVRCTKSGGLIFASSLFNIDVDVDVWSRVVDHTRPSAAEGFAVQYNTYSARTVAAWLEGRVASFRFHRHNIDIDLTFEGRGLGTTTRRLADGSRLQESGGMLLNWAILEIVK